MQYSAMDAQKPTHRASIPQCTFFRHIWAYLLSVLPTSAKLIANVQLDGGSTVFNTSIPCSVYIPVPGTVSRTVHVYW